MAHKKNTTFRTTGYDVMQPPPKAAKPEAFNIPKERVPVLDHLHRVKGHTGKLASEAGLSHFGLKNGGTLQTVQGRKCWVGRADDPRGTGHHRLTRVSGDHAAKSKLAAQLRTDKGSVRG